MPGTSINLNFQVKLKGFSIAHHTGEGGETMAKARGTRTGKTDWRLKELNLAHEAIDALGFGADGISSCTVQPADQRGAYIGRVRTTPTKGLPDLATFGFAPLEESKPNQRIICDECTDDNVADSNWCKHLEFVIRNHLDAVPIHAKQPMGLQVPLVPSARCWKTVELKTRDPLDPDRFEAGENAEWDEEHDSGYPYEAWLVRYTEAGNTVKEYVGMFNKFDSIAMLRRLVFEWIDTVDPQLEQFHLFCTDCGMNVKKAKGADKVTIALEGMCPRCIHKMIEKQAELEERERRGREALAKFQNDPDLVPDTDNPYVPRKGGKTFAGKKYPYIQNESTTGQPVTKGQALKDFVEAADRAGEVLDRKMKEQANKWG